MPNDDLISRKVLLDSFDVHKVTEYDEAGFAMSYNAVPVEVIEKAPAVDAEPVRHARLLSTGFDEAWCEWGDCTNCGMSDIIGSKRCCECGAYLEEER